MQKPVHHILVCASFRTTGGSQGVCFRKGNMELMQYLENEIADRGMGGVAVSSTGCLKICDQGPVMVVYPENWWYGKVASESDIDTILDALEENRPAEKYLIA